MRGANEELLSRSEKDAGDALDALTTCFLRHSLTRSLISSCSARAYFTGRLFGLVAFAIWLAKKTANVIAWKKLRLAERKNDGNERARQTMLSDSLSQTSGSLRNDVKEEEKRAEE